MGGEAKPWKHVPLMRSLAEQKHVCNIIFKSVKCTHIFVFHFFSCYFILLVLLLFGLGYCATLANVDSVAVMLCQMNNERV